MRRHTLLATAFALTGCGARGSLGVETGDTGAPAPEIATIIDLCNADVGLSVRRPSCEFNWHDAPDTAPVFGFEIVGAYRASLRPGAVFEVGDDLHGPVIGARVSASIVEGLTGTIEFTTYDPVGGATGSYEVQWDDGEASGTFSAERCFDSCDF